MSLSKNRRKFSKGLASVTLTAALVGCSSLPFMDDPAVVETASTTTTNRDSIPPAPEPQPYEPKLERVDGPAVLLCAAWFGDVRLIDNVELATA